MKISAWFQIVHEILSFKMKLKFMKNLKSKQKVTNKENLVA